MIPSAFFELRSSSDLKKIIGKLLIIPWFLVKYVTIGLMSESKDDKITIIEGPPPIFEEIMDGWALGVSETTGRFNLSITTLRTFNGPSLLERCHKTWQNGGMMSLHFKDEIGLVQSVPILAARSVETSEGQVLFLWIRRRSDEIKRDAA